MLPEARAECLPERGRPPCFFHPSVVWSSMRLWRRRLRGATRGLARHWFASIGVMAWACGAPAPAVTPPVAPSAPPIAPEPAPPKLLPLAPVPPILVRGVGFQAPESVLHDAVADVYLVSNVNGAPGAQDGNGFISRLAPDGTLLTLKWLAGGVGGVRLDAPKGMALIGDTLYVADINVLRSFDRTSGAPKGDVVISSAGYLNDVAAGSDGTVYVSDSGFRVIKGVAELRKSGTDAIYAVDRTGIARVLIKGAELGQPDGLFVDAQGLAVVNRAGQLSRVTPQGQRELLATLPGAGLDGLAQTPGGRWIVSSWETSTVYMTSAPGAAGAFEPLITELTSPADLAYDAKRRQVLVPQLQEDAIYIQQLPGGAD
jgi:hypothetical protein